MAAMEIKSSIKIIGKTMATLVASEIEIAAGRSIPSQSILFVPRMIECIEMLTGQLA
jgi:hypothetical protein